MALYTENCGKQIKRIKCCKYIRYCVGKLCKTAKGLCYWRGKKISVVAKQIAEPKHVYPKKTTKKNKIKEVENMEEDTVENMEEDTVKKGGRRHGRKHHDAKDVTKRTTCSSVNGHVTGFSGKAFDFQSLGDWVLYKGDKMEIHYRGGRLGGIPRIISRFGLNINNDIVESFRSKLNNIYVNGKAVSLPTGVNYMLPHGGIVLFKDNKIQFKTGSEEADFYIFRKLTRGNYFTAYVRSTVKNVSGLCTNIRVSGKGILKHFKPAVLKNKKKKISCPKRKAFHAFCRKLKIKGVEFKNCVYDLCSKLPKKQVKKTVKEDKKENNKNPPPPQKKNTTIIIIIKEKKHHVLDQQELVI